MADDSGPRARAKKPAKKASAQKAADKAPSKKAPGKKAPGRRSAPSAASRRNDREGATRSRSEREHSRRDGARRLSGSELAVAAAEHLRVLTGRSIEGVIALERSDGAWQVEIEVVELRRVPNTTDVLAAYEVTVDDRGDLISYRRLHRYVRGATGGEDR